MTKIAVLSKIQPHIASILRRIQWWSMLNVWCLFHRNELSTRPIYPFPPFLEKYLSMPYFLYYSSPCHALVRKTPFYKHTHTLTHNSHTYTQCSLKYEWIKKPILVLSFSIGPMWSKLGVSHQSRYRGCLMEDREPETNLPRWTK